MPVDIANLRLIPHVDDLLTRAKQTSWKVVVIELTDQFDTSLMSKALAFQHKGDLLVGETRGSNARLARGNSDLAVSPPTLSI